MTNKGISVGVKITGDAKGFKNAAEDAERATASLKNKTAQHSNDIEANFKNITMSLAKVGAAIIVAQKAFEVFSKVLESNALTGDKFEEVLGGIKETANTLAQNLATLDFSVSLRAAYEAGKSYAGVLDDLEDRGNSIAMISSVNREELATLLPQLKDATLSETKRLEISTRIAEIGKEELADKKMLAEEALKGILDKSQTKYKISLDEAELLVEYLQTYKKYTKEQQDNLVVAQDAQRKYDTWRSNNSIYIERGLYEKKLEIKLQDKLNNAISLVSPELQKYIKLWRPINDLSGDQRAIIRDIVVNWHDANSAILKYLGSTERAQNKISKPVSQIDISKNYTREKYKLKDNPIKSLYDDIEKYQLVMNKAYEAAAKGITPYDDALVDNMRVLETSILQMKELIQEYQDEADAVLRGTEAFKAYARSKNAVIGPQGADTQPLPFETPSTGGWQLDIDPEAVQRATDAINTQIDAVNQLGNSFNQLGSAIGGVDGEWVSYIGNLLSTIPAAIAQLAALTVAHKKKASAEGVDATMGGAAAVSDIPIVGPILAIAAIASIVAALLAIPKFADGGIAYGPTLAQVGEYSGASSNPEVIAPLDKLQKLMGNGGQNIIVTGRIKGDDIYLANTRAMNKRYKNT